MIYDNDLGRIDIHIYSTKVLVRSKHQPLFSQWFIPRLHMSRRAVGRWKDARCDIINMFFTCSNTGLLNPRYDMSINNKYPYQGGLLPPTNPKRQQCHARKCQKMPNVSSHNQKCSKQVICADHHII